ncbi:MAG: S-methyl-5'-thioadenosine phosphorylase [Planctomycetota bacterium]|nr:MAG: S-methyl-5'-thioadenosine phosphorylase [Planctomycetota bacterium]
MAEELIGIIGGTGLGDELGGLITGAKKEDVRTPFGKPSSPILVGNMGERRIAFINRHGPGHVLGPGEVPYTANIFALKKLGARCLIASGAVGSLKEEIAPRDLVVADQFIDKTFRRQGTFFTDFGAVHCELAQPTCERLRKTILASSDAVSARVHAGGTYVCMEGPQFSTRAESLMHRTWGGDLIGMTAMPEAKLARQAQMCYALIALVSDYDCWREHDPNVKKQDLLEEIIANLQAATQNAVELIKAVLQSGETLCSDDCPCRKSLELAVWTKPEKLDPAKRKSLDVLFE